MLLAARRPRDRTRRTTASRRSRPRERLRPDVVLLDIGLPRLNGYEVCRRIRAAAVGHGTCAGGADRLGPGRGPPALEGGRLRRTPGQAGGLRPARQAARGRRRRGLAVIGTRTSPTRPSRRSVASLPRSRTCARTSGERSGSLGRDSIEELGEELGVRLRGRIYKLREGVLLHGLTDRGLQVGDECELEIDVGPRPDVPVAPR